MASPGSLARPLRSEPQAARRPSLLGRLRAFYSGPVLDAELAVGISPTSRAGKAESSALDEKRINAAVVLFEPSGAGSKDTFEVDGKNTA